MSRITRRALAAAPVALAAASHALAAPKPAPPAAAPASLWPDATALAASIRRGELSAAEAVETAIRRAEALQGTLNAIVNSDFDRALAKARAGTPAGRFGGLPFLIKDIDDYVGLPTQFGSTAGRFERPATTQTPFITAFDRAGVIVIGKSATPEAAFLPTTEPLATGPTRNPWDLARSCGGSSGGTAVAVASGMVTASEATDGGGSIRIPASHCGLFGLKPSRGRMIGTMDERSIEEVGARHVLTRSVRDSAAFFALLEDTGAHAQRPPVGLVEAPAKRRLRIGVLRENGLGHRPQPEVVAATDHAVKLLAGLGHHLDETDLPYDGAQFIQDFLALWAQGAMGLADNISRRLGRPADTRELEPFTLGLADFARRMSRPELAAAEGRLNANSLAYDTWFPAHQYDVILSPVVSSGPPLLGEVGPLVPFDILVARLLEYVGYTPIHNIAGAPSMSVPLYWTPEGLPVGTMFSARAGNERTLFELAYELEAAQPWGMRIPPVHV
jgi:amidase